jgi:hypothetical protein
MFSEKKVKMSKARKGTNCEAQYSYFSVVNFRDAKLHTYLHSTILKRQLHDTLIERKIFSIC